MTIQIQLRRDTTANWTAYDPILALGEMGFDTDLLKFKVGDGTTPWSALPFSLTGPPGPPSGTFLGTWDASTNTPTITSSVGTLGDYYVVQVGGTTTINGNSTWGVSDWVVFDGSTWQRIPNSISSPMNLILTGF